MNRLRSHKVFTSSEENAKTKVASKIHKYMMKRKAKVTNPQFLPSGIKLAKFVIYTPFCDFLKEHKMLKKQTTREIMIETVYYLMLGETNTLSKRKFANKKRRRSRNSSSIMHVVR